MNGKRFYRQFQSPNRKPKISLEDGARVAVMGGGPSGSLFAYFLLDLAQRIDLHLQVDIYEPRDFVQPGSSGCNMCAGIISESLIQMLAVDGINLPPDVVQRGMNSYTLHNHSGQARLETPRLEKRIGVVFRGAGPKGIQENEWRSFDGYLLDQAVARGANRIKKRIHQVRRGDGCVWIDTPDQAPQQYDFLAVAAGVNSSAIKLFGSLDSAYQPPKTARTFIHEYYLGKEQIERTFGSSIHFFLLDLPGLDFAAVVPKGSYVTICLLGNRLSQELLDRFLDSPQVKSCMPTGWKADEFACHCSPRINQTGAIHPYAERMVFLGDIGISRLYKDGIGAAYRAAKAAATAAIFDGIGEADLGRRFATTSLRFEKDNGIGKIIFWGVGKLVKPLALFDRGVIRMVVSERYTPPARQRMSAIIWDIFTGSATYRDIFRRMVHPAFWMRFLWYSAAAAGGRYER